MKWSDWIADIKTIFPMMFAILRGQYKMPWGTLLWIIICVVYLISPTDMVPDILPLLGLADDGAFVIWVLLRVHKDLQNFRTQQINSKIILEAEVSKTDKK